MKPAEGLAANRAKANGPCSEREGARGMKQILALFGAYEKIKTDRLDPEAARPQRVTCRKFTR